MNKLELKHIAPYLPYRLQIVRPDNKTKMLIEGVLKDLLVVFENGEEKYCSLNGVKPILRPMSDLFKLIDWDNNGDPYRIGGKMGLIQIIEDGDLLIVEELYAEQCESPVVYLDARYCNWWLFEHHFDVFGLIEKGLAIDKNTIEL